MKIAARGRAKPWYSRPRMGIPLTEAIVLGVVQGITEFLPISSDGHLALAQLLFGGQADLATTVLLHAGTLSATILVLRKRVGAAIADGVRGVARPALWKETQGGRDAVVVVLATIPTALVGLGLKKSVEAWSSSPTIIGVGFLVTAAVVGSTLWAPKDGTSTASPGRGQHPVDNPTYVGSVLVGLAQGAAVLPGVSRSALTIATLLWMGVRSERAFELSFLMSLPAIAGAIILEARHAFHGGDDPAILIFATFISFVVGIGALMLLRAMMAKRVLPAFAIYLVPLAIATLAWGYARP